MQKIKRLITGIILVFCLPLCIARAADPNPLDVSTDVKFQNTGFAISAMTSDCTVEIDGTQTLQVAATGLMPLEFEWKRSTDGGNSWQTISGATTSRYDITHAQENTPADLPYIYRVTVTDDGGYTGEAQTRVLVANRYAYRKIIPRVGDTDVTAYMHDETWLVITPLDESDPDAQTLENEMTAGCVPIMIVDASLYNLNAQVVPYFGQLQIDFHVGTAYNGQTLKAFHLINGGVETRSGVVADGKLSIVVDALSPFLVEAPGAGTHAITASAGAGGSISPSGTLNVTAGSSRTFTFLPNTGFAVKTVTVDRTPVTVTGNSYTLLNVQADTSIAVTFRAVTPSSTMHTVTVDPVTNGAVSPSGTTQVQHGKPQTFYFHPDAGYTLDELYINGVLVNVLGNSYTIPAVEGDVTIRATFKVSSVQPPNVYKTLTATAGPNGSISPVGNVDVEYGGDMYFYFIPAAGYEVDAVTVDGGTPGPASGNAYQFINVIAEHTIHVTFKPLPNLHSITASTGANGSISPSGAVPVADGGSQTFSFIPNTGYVVDTVTVDGTALTSPNTSYTFLNVTGDHTISVTFKAGTAPPVTYYAITVIAPAGGGTIAPAGVIQVPAHGSQTFYFLPNTGYVLDTVTIDGVLQTGVSSSYTFTDVTGPHTVSATFRSLAQYHTITASASGYGGHISPAGAVLVPTGGAQTFYFIPSSGYAVSEIWIDGVKLSGVVYQYTFTDVQTDHTIHVVFHRTATPPTGDTDNKLLWALLIAASVLLAVVCLLFWRKLHAPKPPEPPHTPDAQQTSAKPAAAEAPAAPETPQKHEDA